MNPNPKIENLSPWKPGQSGNPSGRSAVAEEARGLKKFDKDSFGRLCQEALDATDAKAQSIIRDPEAPQSIKYLISIILKGRSRGDYHAYDWLLVRSGLPALKDKFEITGEDGAPLQLDGQSLAQRQELIVRILVRSKLIDDPQVREILKRRFLASEAVPMKD